MEQRAKGQVRPVRPGLRSRPMVVGTSPILIDPPFDNEPPLGPRCPPEADYMVRSPFPSGDSLLCLDTQAGRHQHATLQVSTSTGSNSW